MLPITRPSSPKNQEDIGVAGQIALQLALFTLQFFKTETPVTTIDHHDHFHDTQLFARSLNAFAAVNPGELLALISISSPVCGLRPFLAARARSWKDPKPAKLTFLPATTFFFLHSGRGVKMLDSFLL